MIYFLSIPATNNTIISDTIYVIAVPKSGCNIINNTGTATVAKAMANFQILFISSFPFICNLAITYDKNSITVALAISPG